MISFQPLLYVSKSGMYPVSLALKLFCDPGSSSDYGAMFAMATLSILPSILIFLFFQKYLVEGISTSGSERVMKMEHEMKIIDGHVHLVQCIAGTGAGGELQLLPETAWRNMHQGSGFRMLPDEFSAREW